VPETIEWEWKGPFGIYRDLSAGRASLWKI